MPGFPIAACETSYARSTDQTSRPDAPVHLSTEEEHAAEESLSIYCKPVELYNMLRLRAISNPTFLQRCLDYRIKAKHKKRIKMTVSLSWSVDETQTAFPLYICLARQVSKDGDAEYTAVYRISRICIFRDSFGTDGNTEVQANFMLPELDRLAVEARSGTLFILFFTTVDNPNSSSDVNASPVPLDLTSDEPITGEYCLSGNVSLESLYMAWNSSPTFILGQRAEMMSTVDFLPCILKYQDKDQSVSIQSLSDSENLSASKKLQITVSAEEFGAKDRFPYQTYASSDVSSPSLSRIIRLREGNVMFHYRYYNNQLLRTEVTEDFYCPFCLVGCGSYKGLQYHLFASHDLFNFEFLASEDQAVNVSVNTDILKSEIVADDIDPKSETFIFCAKPLKRTMPVNLSSENAKDADPADLGSEIPTGDGDTELVEKADGDSGTIIQSHLELDGVPLVSEPDHATPALQPAAQAAAQSAVQLAAQSAVQLAAQSAVHQVAKKGKLLVEDSDSRSTYVLRKRQFYHSRTFQPMSYEEVMSGHDSEDEFDHDIADIEDRRVLETFVDVTKHEKEFMLMWNSFKRRQRVLADGHINWSCQAFSTLHASKLVQSPGLIWCWRLFMVKLWNHRLLDAKIMNACNLYLDEYLHRNSIPQS